MRDEAAVRPGLALCVNVLRLSPTPYGDPHVRHRHRRQPAQTRLAGRDPETLAAMEGPGCRAGAGQARRHAAVDQGPGRRGPERHRRRRAEPPALRARLPGAGRRHRLRAQGRDGHPQRPLQGDGAAGGGAVEAQGPRARSGSAFPARAHHAQDQVHAARAADHRRHRGRPLLRRPQDTRLRLRRTAQPGSAGAAGRRRGRDPVRRAGFQRLYVRRRRMGRGRAGTRGARPEGARHGQWPLVHDGGAHLLRLRHPGQQRLEADAGAGMAPVRAGLPGAREELHRSGQPGVHPLARAARTDGTAEGQGRDGGRDRRCQRAGGNARGSGRHHRPRAAVRAARAPHRLHQLRPGADEPCRGRGQAGGACAGRGAGRPASGRPVKLSRLWQPRRGLFWVMVAFNGLSSLGAWALRSLPLEGAVFAVVALLSLMNCAGGLLAAWRLVTEPPAASG